MTEHPAPGASPGRVLGIDPGDARHGIAISDDDRRVAVPLGTVRAGAPQDLRAILRLVRDNDVSQVVVGHPLALSGEARSRARNAEELAGALRAVLPVPVALQDERLSSVEAERGLRRAGASGRDRRRALDRSAATIILQAWLDAHRG